MDLARWEPMSYARSLAAMAAFCSTPLVGGLRPGCRPLALRRPPLSPPAAGTRYARHARPPPPVAAARRRHPPRPFAAGTRHRLARGGSRCGHPPRLFAAGICCRPPPAPADPRSPSAPATGCPRRVPAAGRGRTCSGELQDRPARAPTAAVAHSVSTSDTSSTRTKDCASNSLNRTYRFGRWVVGWQAESLTAELWPVAIRHDLRESWRMAGRSHLLTG